MARFRARRLVVDTGLHAKHCTRAQAIDYLGPLARAEHQTCLMERHMVLNTYLNYGGNCEQAFKFYEQQLGGSITMLMRHGEAPGGRVQRQDWQDKVLHARLAIGGTALFGADIPDAQPMRSAYLSLTLASVEEAERVYALLSENGEIFMPMEETFFATRFAMLRDRFGTSWMLLGPAPQPGGLSQR